MLKVKKRIFKIGCKPGFIIVIDCYNKQFCKLNILKILNCFTSRRELGVY